MRYTLLLLLLCLSPCRADYWSDDKTTNALIIADNVLLGMDWLQTRYIAKNPDRFHETGIAEHFIGRHPTTREVDQFFASWIVGTNLLIWALPEEATTFGIKWNPKKTILIFDAATSAHNVINNARVGIHFDL
jgi:hypothetical protein